MESYLKKINWSAPWLHNVSQLGAAIAATNDWRLALNACAQKRRLVNHAERPIQFVPQSALPCDTAYESFINATGNVPTRDNLHDFFNALVWLTFPQTKAQLNALQAEHIEAHGIGKSRGPLRDAATLFDENAALLAITDTPEGYAIEAALRARDWHRLFVQERQQFMTHAEAFLFGHALMEKLVQPYKAITAHAFICWVDAEFHALSSEEKRAHLDRHIAHALTQTTLSTHVFTPLPVLGVPMWWPDQTEGFYSDVSVFRPA